MTRNATKPAAPAAVHVYVRGCRDGVPALTADGYDDTWRQRHLGLFGAVLVRRRLGLPSDAVVTWYYL